MKKWKKRMQKEINDLKKRHLTLQIRLAYDITILELMRRDIEKRYDFF